MQFRLSHIQLTPRKHICDTWQVKIFDFGLAKLSAVATRVNQIDKHITRDFFSFSASVFLVWGTSERAKTTCDPFNGKQQQVSQTAIGTPGYAPPEHCIHLEQNKKVGALAIFDDVQSAWEIGERYVWTSELRLMQIETSDRNSLTSACSSNFPTKSWERKQSERSVFIHLWHSIPDLEILSDDKHEDAWTA